MALVQTAVPMEVDCGDMVQLHLCNQQDPTVMFSIIVYYFINEITINKLFRYIAQHGFIFCLV